MTRDKRRLEARRRAFSIRHWETWVLTKQIWKLRKLIRRELAYLRSAHAASRGARDRGRRPPAPEVVLVGDELLGEELALEAHCQFWRDVWGATSQSVSCFQTVVRELRVLARHAPVTFSWDQFLSIIQGLPTGKAADGAGITYESVRCLPESFLLALFASFQQLLLDLLDDDVDEPISHSWLHMLVSLIPKGAGKLQIHQWRPIGVSSILLKVFSRLLLLHVQPALESMPAWIQGFRPGFSTVHSISAVGLLVERCNEWSMPLAIAKLDVKKAYDHVERHALLHALKGVVPAHVLLAYAHIFATSATLQWGDLQGSNPIVLTRGCTQGDPSSPALFALLTSAILQPVHARWVSDGLISWGDLVWDTELLVLGLLLYADDILLLASSLPALLRQIKDIEEALLLVGLHLSHEKTVVAINACWAQVWGGQIPLQQAVLQGQSTLSFLGSLVPMHGRWDDAVQANLRKAERAMWQSASQLRLKHLGLARRLKLLQHLVLSVLLYACEPWILSKHLAQQIERFHLRAIHFVLQTQRRSGETWVHWYRRSVRVARAMRRKYMQRPWLSLLLARQHRWWLRIRKGMSIPSQVLQWRSLEWWRLAQVMSVRHPRRFSPWRWESQFCLAEQSYPTMDAWEHDVEGRQDLWIQHRLCHWELHAVTRYRLLVLVN